VQAGDKVALAGDKVKESGALDKVKDSAVVDKVKESGVLDKAQEARIQVQRDPFPFAAVLAAGVALVGIILIVRGRRQ